MEPNVEQRTNREGQVYHDNLAILTACTELATAVLSEVLGGDEASNQIGDIRLTGQDLQEIITARLATRLGV